MTLRFLVLPASMTRGAMSATQEALSPVTAKLKMSWELPVFLTLTVKTVHFPGKADLDGFEMVISIPKKG